MNTEQLASVTRVKNALAAMKQGQLIIVADDAQREHEGDLIGLAAFVSDTTVNQMLTLGRGLLCVPMSAPRATKLGLTPMVSTNTEKFGTKFTVSVDHKDTVTGVSVADRTATIKALADGQSLATDFERPGHILPLIAEEGGVLVRPGHTEAAVDLAKLAGVPPVSYIIEILNSDGTMAREAQLATIAKDNQLIQISIQDIITYRHVTNDAVLQPGPTVKIPSEYGNFKLTAFPNSVGEPDLLIASQKVSTGIPLVRLHSECFTGDVLGSQRCECGPQLHAALQAVDVEGGYIIYLRQEGRGIGLTAKLQAYTLQEGGFDTYDANTFLGHLADARSYEHAAAILKAQGITQVRLLTNNPEKIADLEHHGIQVVERVPLQVGENANNEAYLATKKSKFNHML
ncbi:GTP cyclohydrolase II [Periweissella fabalis]|uniref:GTP cyclohydrolase II n=1 Tax=Periweissella fabalis TaxID=1070421 RepID=A0A7X6S3G9_9LACO|nr:GTP cyclohydrolase II [Periweissella fabalis]MCM0598424.1 GTP cyclohydrolase II [Periweissella fabalis]NKZ25055.1 GTP cyclohydrolase II [Periweissella fabalis]